MALTRALGVASVVLAVLAVLVPAVALALLVVSGEASFLMGTSGFIGAGVAAAGVLTGALSLSRRTRGHGAARVGLAMSGAVLLAFVVLLVLGIP